MLPASSFTPRAWRIVGCALLLLLPSTSAWAAPSIDLSLNVLYSNPGNPSSGGNWELVAKTNSDGFGLYGLSALLTNIATAQSTAPRGLVNSSDLAGMWLFANTSDPAGYRNLTLGQASLTNPAPSGKEQTVFYGIGTLSNGAPNYAGKPMGSNFIGPLFTSLTGVTGVAWADTNTFNDPAWVTAAKLATGTFAPGVTPGFYNNGDDFSRGNVFTSLGNSMNAGNFTNEFVMATTFVRTNLMQNADYNHNGIVDAADYVVWRNTLGSTTLLDADGNNNGMIDAGDHEVWKANFGTMPAAAAAAAQSSTTIPEPSAALLLAISTALTLPRRRRSPTSPSGRGRE